LISAVSVSRTGTIYSSPAQPNQSPCEHKCARARAEPLRPYSVQVRTAIMRHTCISTAESGKLATEFVNGTLTIISRHIEAQNNACLRPQCRREHHFLLADGVLSASALHCALQHLAVGRKRTSSDDQMRPLRPFRSNPSKWQTLLRAAAQSTAFSQKARDPNSPLREGIAFGSNPASSECSHIGQRYLRSRQP
jgi:hypothetical protein